MRAWHFARTAQHTWEGVSAAQRGDWGAAFTQGQAAFTSWGQFTQPCFAAGMPVRTPDGSKLVESVIVGDVLLSRDEFDPNGEVLGKVVEQVFVRQAKVLELGMKGRVIRTTAEHPFFAEGRGWVPAGVLEVGQKLWSEASGWLTVDSVTDTGKEETVYNFRVADFHTYFVGCDEWGFSVWAHNSYVSPELARRARALRNGETNEIVVRNVDDALEVFFREFRSGEDTPSYTNTTGWTKAQVDVHGKAGTYHWDTVVGEVESAVRPGQKILRGHYDDDHDHSYVPHLQIHTHGGEVIRILMDPNAFK